jgi:protein TonB
MAPRRVVTLLSVVIHAIAIAGLVVANLRAVGPLPDIRRPLTFENVRMVQVRDIDLPPPPRAATAPSSGATASASAAPLVAPSNIAPETGLENVRASSTRADVIDVEGGGSGFEGLSGNTAPPPPPPAPPQRPVPLHSGMQAPRKIADVAPIYPAMARAAHVEGVVILEAVIDATGTVTSVRVLRSIPLLDQAAIDAVRQWRFTPTLLSGTPVPIVMTVTVNFALTR